MTRSTPALLSALLLLLALSAAPRLASAQAPACDIRVCFAIDASEALEDTFFVRASDIVNNVVDRLVDRGGEIELASAQFSTETASISELTTEPEFFSTLLLSTRPDRRDGTFLTGGLNYCLSQLPFEGRFSGRSAIVVLGSGKNTLGAPPTDRARLFERLGGRVYTVGMGQNPDLNALRAISGSDDRSFRAEPEAPEWDTGLPLTKALCDI